MRARRLLAVSLTSAVSLTFAMGATLIGAPSAWAHAQLLGTSPASGSTVQTQPKDVIFEFDQDVGGTFGAVRVYNSEGSEVDNLEVGHPNGNEHWMGVGLKPGLPEGTYTATYRVISADTHIVYGGLVFNLGHASASSKVTVAGLIARNEGGRVTKIAFGVVRTLDYLTIALMVGGLAFSLLVWPRALAGGVGGEPSTRDERSSGGDGHSGDDERSSTGDGRSGGDGHGDDDELWNAAADVGEEHPREVEGAFAASLNRLLAGAVLVGVSVSVLGILLQGASAAGVSLWNSLTETVVRSTLESRFGWVWAVRALVWLALGVLLVLRRAQRNGDWPAPESGRIPVAVGAAAASRRSTRTAADVAVTAGLALGSAYLVITPALAGHASVHSPTGVFFPSDAIHVAAASVWIGGIACLLLALPAATRRLPPPQRSRLLLATLACFSPLALGAVIAIALTGIVQAYIDVRSLHGLLHTTYGALILVKTALLLALIGLGWVNRQRVIPALRGLAARASGPGRVGQLVRRALRGELALMVGVFGITAALVSYAPPIDAATGPFSVNTTIGPALLEMTVEPAKVGLNTLHLYLIDAKTGAQFTATKELTVAANLPTKRIGPLPLHPTVAGPGHYIIASTALSPGGSWEIAIVDRVSEFEEYTRVVRVPIG